MVLCVHTSFGSPSARLGCRGCVGAVCEPPCRPRTTHTHQPTPTQSYTTCTHTHIQVILAYETLKLRQAPEDGDAATHTKYRLMVRLGGCDGWVDGPSTAASAGAPNHHSLSHHKDILPTPIPFPFPPDLSNSLSTNRPPFHTNIYI